MMRASVSRSCGATDENGLEKLSGSASTIHMLPRTTGRGMDFVAMSPVLLKALETLS